MQRNGFTVELLQNGTVLHERQLHPMGAAMASLQDDSPLTVRLTTTTHRPTLAQLDHNGFPTLWGAPMTSSAPPLTPLLMLPPGITEMRNTLFLCCGRTEPFLPGKEVSKICQRPKPTERNGPGLIRVWFHTDFDVQLGNNWQHFMACNHDSAKQLEFALLLKDSGEEVQVLHRLLALVGQYEPVFRLYYDTADRAPRSYEEIINPPRRTPEADDGRGEHCCLPIT